MAGSLNEVKLIGNLCADPDVRSFQSGGKVANIRIATNETWKDRDGNKQERVEYHTVAIFGEGLVGVAERFLRKGSKVYLCGQLRTRKYQAQDGSDRYSTEVVLQGPSAKMLMLDGAQGGNRNEGQRNNSGWGGSSGGDWNAGGSTGGNSGGTSTYDDLDDDIPFLTSNGIF